MKKMVFATRQMQDRPVTLGDQTFYSRLLTGAEELLVAEHDALTSLTPKRSEALALNVQLMLDLLRPRLRDKVQIDEAWVRTHLGMSNATKTIAYLRLGNTLKPGETLSLELLPEEIEIGERQFVPRPLCFAEQIRSAEAIESVQPDPSDRIEEPEEEDALLKAKTYSAAREQVKVNIADARRTIQTGADQLATFLNARIPEGDDQEALIDGDWLFNLLSNKEIGQISTYLSQGEVPEEEEADPNAEGAEVATS